jgi:cytochrome c oxidase subunit 2
MNKKLSGSIACLAMAAMLMGRGSVGLCQSKEKEKVIRITAKKFEFSPAKITVKVGKPIVLEFVSLDRKHGVNSTELGIRADIKPGKPIRIRLVPAKTGTFEYHCDVFCGDGHEEMSGTIVVE